MDDDEGRNAAKLAILKHHLSQHGALSAALISFFQSALRTSLFLNGGAIAATLSLYGAKGGALPTAAVFYLKGGLFLWLAGLMIAAMSGIVIALGQREFQVVAGDEFRRQARELFGLALGNGDATACHQVFGRVLRGTFLVLWTLSIALFGGGAVFAIQGMT